MSQPVTRLLELDVYRGLAAVAVMMFHYTTVYERTYDHSGEMLFDFNLGYYGVQLFFIISGFVILLTLNRTRSAQDFLVSRFSRLYPVYWAAVVTTFTATSLFGVASQQSTVVELLANLTMIHSLIDIKDVDGVYWTLIVELHFYAMMLGIYLIKQLHRVEWICLAWVLAQLTSVAIEHFYGWFPWIVTKHLLFEYCNFFAAGVFFYGVFTGGYNRLRVVSLLTCLVATYFVDSLIGFCAALIFFTMFHLFVKNRVSFIVAKPLVFLGTISYSLYLVHQNIGYIVITHLNAYGSPFLVNIVMAMIVSITISALLTTRIEKPALRYIRRRYKEFKAQDLQVKPST